MSRRVGVARLLVWLSFGALACGGDDDDDVVEPDAGAPDAFGGGPLEPFPDHYCHDVGEPYVDANDNGEFDPIWIAGLANSHPAVDVRDGLWGLMYDARPRGEA